MKRKKKEDISKIQEDKTISGNKLELLKLFVHLSILYIQDNFFHVFLSDRKREK